MNLGPHATLSVRHDEFAHRFAAMPDLRSMNGNGNLALIRGEVYYGETVIAKRIDSKTVKVFPRRGNPAIVRATLKVVRALEAEGYKRGRISPTFDRYEK